MYTDVKVAKVCMHLFGVDFCLNVRHCTAHVASAYMWLEYLYSHHVCDLDVKVAVTAGFGLVQVVGFLPDLVLSDI